MKQSKNCLPCFVELISTTRSGVFRRGNILGRTTITIAIRSLLARFPKAHLIDPGFTPAFGGAVGGKACR